MIVASTSGIVALLQRHYDKILALLVVLALVGSIMRLVTSSARIGAEERGYRESMEALEPVHPKAEITPLQPYSNALALMSNPFRIPLAAERSDGFFVPEARVWCVSCRRPIPRSATNCPYADCGAKQTVEPDKVEGYDSDGGGIPDAWEEQYGLNPHDAADDRIDSDGDGFNNYEEYLAGTDPTDPESHPDVASRLRVKDIQVNHIPIKFMGATKMPDGRYRCQINLKPAGADAADTYFVTEGNPIGKTDFTLLEHELIVERRPDPMMGNRERNFEVHQIVLGRGGKKIVLRQNEDAVDPDFHITLVLTLDDSVYELTGEGTLRLRGEKYRVISVDSQANTVVLRNDANGRELTVPELP